MIELSQELKTQFQATIYLKEFFMNMFDFNNSLFPMSFLHKPTNYFKKKPYIVPYTNYCYILEPLTVKKPSRLVFT